MNPAEFPIQTFLIELNHHFQNVDHPGLSGMLQEMVTQPPSPNPQLEAKTPYFKKELDQSIQDMNGSTHSLKSLVNDLSANASWQDASRGVPEFMKKGYSFTEIIGQDGFFLHDSLRLGFFLQAPWIDYPAHAHDAEEWYLVLSGRAEWQIDDDVYQAEEGTIFHHPPTAGHRMLTFENPLLAIWIWTGAIHGRYWFVGHEEIDCQLK